MQPKMPQISRVGTTRTIEIRFRGTKDAETEVQVKYPASDCFTHLGVSSVSPTFLEYICLKTESQKRKRRFSIVDYFFCVLSLFFFFLLLFHGIQKAESVEIVRLTDSPFGEYEFRARHIRLNPPVASCGSWCAVVHYVLEVRFFCFLRFSILPSVVC
jgi:hypothetical protein